MRTLDILFLAMWALFGLAFGIAILALYASGAVMHGVFPFVGVCSVVAGILAVTGLAKGG